jgi:hypothetical protein
MNLKLDQNNPMIIGLRYLLAAQLIPICLVLSPYLFIIRRNIEQFALTATLVFTVAATYLIFNLIVLAGFFINKKATLKFFFAYIIFFLLMNVAPFVVSVPSLWLDMGMHLVFVGIAIMVAYKLDIEKILFIFALSTLLLSVDITLNSVKITNLYRDEILRANLSEVRTLDKADIENISISEPAQRAGNVYHIVLDGFQSSAFEDALNLYEQKLPEEFISIEDFHSSYTVTSYSLSNILHGEYHTPETDLYDWQYNSFQKEGLYYDLAQRGVKTHLYPYYAYFCSENAENCHIANPYVDDFVKEQSVFQVVDLWFKYFIPSFLDKILCENCRFDQDDQARTDFGFSITDELGLKSPDFVPVNLMPYYSVKSVDRFIEHEKQRPRSGQYVFMHLELPHPPYIYDQNCQSTNPIRDFRYLNAEHSYYDLYVMQSSCALKLLNNMVAAIKDAGGYEESLIIVHSDHGFKFMDIPEIGYKSYYELTQEQRAKTDVGQEYHQELLESFTDVILFIKPPQNVSVSANIPIQPIDLAPMVKSHFSLETKDMMGLTLSQLQAIEQESRAPQKLYFNFFKLPELVPDPFYNYERDADSWVPINKESLKWKGQVYYD